MMDSFEVTAVLRDFSISDNSSELEVSDYSLGYFREIDGLFGPKFLFYADGNCEENKGYVSIICSGMFRVLQIPLELSQEFEVRYFFSVVDISENKRFTQSIVLIPGKTAPRDSKKDSRGNFDFGLERYLKREILLNDPAELLPGDCLTILVEIEYINLSFVPEVSGVDIIYVYQRNEARNPTDDYNSNLKLYCIDEFSFWMDKSGRLCISLDTFYGRELCNFSGFFRLASNTPLTEGLTREVHIPDEELVACTNIFNIIFKPTTVLVVDSIKDICHLYVTADKYDFQSVIQTCRQLIKAFLLATNDPSVREHATQTIPNIIELADQYEDRDLKDTGKTYLESKESFGTDEYALGKCLEEKIFSDWKCVSRVDGRNLSRDTYQFKFSRTTKLEFESYL